MHVNAKKISVSETFVNPAEMFSLVWLRQTFTQNFSERLINEAQCEH